MNKRRLYYLIPILLLLAVAVAGWFATDYLGRKARQEIIAESQSSVLTLSIYVSSSLNYLEGAVQSLAGSPWIAPALLSGKDQDIGHANSVLDRYSSALNASVSYLMDAGGMTVAASNRNEPDSFLGKSYRFRPYFQEAAQGRHARYFALGITSGKRGFYASHPLQNRQGKMVGVVAMKKDLDEMETFFSKYPFCFLISPDGVIFLSSSPAMVLKSLWPLDRAVRERLTASQQFGHSLSDAAFFKKEITDGTEVTLQGNGYRASRKMIDREGWSIVLLTPTERVRLYEGFGILATISLVFIIIVFSGIIYGIDRSREAIRQSEESRRLLLQAIGDGVFGVNAQGELTFVNPAALRMLGFSAEEMLGRSVHALIHHSHGDGSNYALEECPMYASYARAVDSHVLDETLWRKDGSSFPVEYSSMPIIQDGKIVGAVVSFKDITDRKQSEETLERSLKEALRLAKENEIVADIGRAISSTLSIEEIYKTFSEKVRELIPFDRIVINLIDLEKNSYSVQYHEGIFVEGRQRGDAGHLEGTVTEQIRRTGKGFIVSVESAMEIEKEYPGLLPEFEHGIRSFLTVPLIHKDLVIGGLALRSTKPGTYSDRDLVLAGIIASQIAGAVSNAKLFAENKQSEEKIRQMAYHDSLTGLPNRKLFSDRLEIALTQARRNQERVGVAMLDLDHFKDVNDTLGHDAGDLLLKATAERLGAALRKGDTVARFGGDEFVLILPGLKGAEDAIPVAGKIVDGFRMPFLIDTHSLVVTTSVGIAVSPEDGMEEGTLLKNADIAMYQAKQSGRNRYRLYKEI